MRDPARIDQVLVAIRKVWVEDPDSRLGQLLVNAVRATDPGLDLFSLEDTALVRKLEAFARLRRRTDA